MKYKNLIGYVLAGLIIIGLSPIILDIKKNQRSNALAVTKITPKEGPTAGGNTIVIEGSDFKKRVTVKQISVGGGVTCLLSSEQKVYCWGDNFYGAVGNGEGGPGGLNHGAEEFKTLPQAIVRGEIPDGVKIKQISSGTHVVYAIGTDDQIYFWGAHQFSPRKLSSVYPGASLPNGVVPVKIQAGYYNATSKAVILGSDNKVYVHDENHGLLPVPAGQISSAEKIVDVAFSKETKQWDIEGGAICALTNLGKAYCSLSGAGPFTTIPQGQIPTGAKIANISVAAASTDTDLVPAPLNNFCVLTTDGQAYCWGTIGVDGTINYHAAPTLVKMPPNKKVKKIKTGQIHICLISDDDQAYCWSNENFGGIGIDRNNVSPYQPNPILAGQIPAGVKIVDIDPNSSDIAFETCAIGDNKKAYCWGSNFLGQSQLDGKPFEFEPENPDYVNNPTLVPFGTDDETKVTIDGIPVTARIINQQRLEFTAPPHAPGKVDVVVMNKTDVVTLVKGYTYVDNINPQPSQPQPQPQPQPTEPNKPVNNKTLTPNSGYQKQDYRIALGVLISGVALLIIGLISACRKKLKNN